MEAAELEPFFNRFLEIYSPLQLGGNVPPDADPLQVGERLSTLIQDQWGTFSERLARSDRQDDLLNEIFTTNCAEEEILDAPDIHELWTDRNWLHTSLLDRWYELADELRHPEEHAPIAQELQPTEEDLATAGDTLEWFSEDVDRASTTLPAGSRIFRVRLGYQNQDYRIVPIPPAEMGAPPQESVKVPGRANPVGVSYFYCAEEEQTAVAEKQPHRGALSTIGVGETLRDLRLINLAAGMGIGSPFECPEGFLHSLTESCELFNHLDTEFAKPLRHEDDTHEYRPTQFFAEWAKSHGYDGLRYSSAMYEGGRNVVLFDPTAVSIRTVRLVETVAVEVSYQNYPGEGDPRTPPAPAPAVR